jgi:hypothetical protein
MALPATWDDFTASIERDLNRNIEPMDYIQALYTEVARLDQSVAGVAQAASAVNTPSK